MTYANSLNGWGLGSAKLSYGAGALPDPMVPTADIGSPLGTGTSLSEQISSLGKAPAPSSALAPRTSIPPVGRDGAATGGVLGSLKGWLGDLDNVGSLMDGIGNIGRV